MNPIHDFFRREGLVRPQNGRLLGGVCAGLGKRLGLEPMPARLLFVLVLFLIPGSHLIVYPILWILMPAAGPTDAGSYLPPTPVPPHMP